MGWYAYGQFMEESRKYEYHRARGIYAPAATDQWWIDVPSHEVVNRLIPCPPVTTDAWAVPPFRVEFTVAKLHYFGQCVEHWLKEGKKACEPDDKRYGRQLHQPFNYGGDIKRGDFMNGIAKNRGCILRWGHPDEDAENDDLT